MKIASPLPSIRLRKPKLPGVEALEALIDQYPGAALLVDLKAGRVLAANSKATELTTYTRRELNDLGLETLFPHFQLPLFGEEIQGLEVRWELDLRKRNGASSEVSITLNYLDSSQEWAFFYLEPTFLAQHRQAERERRTRIWEALRNLAISPQAVENPMALKLVLEAGAALTGAPIQVIYRGEGDTFVLKRTAMHGPGEMLPEQIHPNDLIALQSPQIWLPRQRALSSLHRAARTSNLSFLASAPLGQPNALIGLLAIASDQAPPADEVLETLQVFAATVTTIIQNQSLAHAVKQREQEFLREEAILTAIKETIQEAIVVVTPDLHIRELNPAAEAILGYAGWEAAGQYYRDVLVGTENLVPAFTPNQPGIVIHDLGNIKLYRRDGEIFLAHVRTLPITIDGRLTSLLVLIRDLSQEEMFRQHSQQLEQRAVLGEVSASFAHEVRNAINNLSTGLQLMEYQLPTEDPNQEVIGRLKMDCTHLNEMMKSMLTFSKPIEYNLAPVDLEMSLRRLLERQRMSMARKNVQQVFQVEPGTPLVNGDQRALEQVWTNLINNAIQAMEQNGGTLGVKVRPVTMPDNTLRVEVSVSDTGTGIPEEAKDRIFEPFYTTKASGTGLGLAIIKQIVTAHKGSIRFTSIPGGTVFQVQLPLANHKSGQEITV